MKNFNLTEAAKEILSTNVASKQGGQEHGVGDTKLQGSVAYGTKEAGLVGKSPEKKDDDLPDYLKGTPSATPPGATPPVGSEPKKVLAKQPQETQGRSDLTSTMQASANEYDQIRDRVASKLAPQTFEKNAGATFQSYSEEIESILAGEELSEDFKSKAATIFEAAVVARASEVIAEAEAEMMEQFDIAIDQIKEELAEKVDGYLNYIVQEWAKDNELAIVSGLRAEIAEDFINGLRNLFVEHYIDIPEEKVDIIKELADKVESLEESLNNQIKTSVELTKELNEHKKFEAIYAACDGLTQTQVEKLKSLAESVEFTTEEEFNSKLETIKESYLVNNGEVKFADSSALDDEVQIIEEATTTKGGSVDPEMATYAKTISQTLIK